MPNYQLTFIELGIYESLTFCCFSLQELLQSYLVWVLSLPC